MGVRRAKKSQRRMETVEAIVNCLTSRKVYNVIGQTSQEVVIKSFLYPKLVDTMERVYDRLYPEQRDRTVGRKADRAVLWESDQRSVINHIRCFGVQHRPDFLVKTEGMNVAVEVKIGETGSALREGLGQALVYSTCYDFVIYLFVDQTRDKKIRGSTEEVAEAHLIDELWRNFNVKFVIA